MKLQLCKKFGTLLDFEEKLLKRRFFNTEKGLFCKRSCPRTKKRSK
jgi:hypothetical protein